MGPGGRNTDKPAFQFGRTPFPECPTMELHILDGSMAGQSFEVKEEITTVLYDNGKPQSTVHRQEDGSVLEESALQAPQDSI